MFSWGYADWYDQPSKRSIQTFSSLQALGCGGVSPQVVEARGAMAGLTDRLYMRRDRAEHSSSIAAAAWAKKFALVLPEQLLYSALTDDTIADKKPTVVALLTSTLKDHPDLDRELQGIIATTNARLSAEGTTAAGSILNLHKNFDVPNLDDTHAAELAKVQKSGSYRQDLALVAALVISGLAGDLVIHVGALVNGKSTPGEIRDAIPATINKGDGAVFYLGMAAHSTYAGAQLQHIQDAGEKVDFITSGDGRVCSLCLSAEDGNPYTPDDVPPIPNHGGCRCWYAPAGAIT